MSGMAALADVPSEDLDRALDLDLRGAFFCMKYATLFNVTGHPAGVVPCPAGRGKRRRIAHRREGVDLTQQRNRDSIHPPLAGYSHQIELRAPERLLVLSGQVGMAPDGDIPDDAAEQLDVAFDNVLRNLDAASMRVEDLVKLTFYLTAPIDAAKRRAMLSERLGGHTPSMTLIDVAGLVTPAIKVEVDAWASAAREPVRAGRTG